MEKKGERKLFFVSIMDWIVFEVEVQCRKRIRKEGSGEQITKGTYLLVSVIDI